MVHYKAVDCLGRGHKNTLVYQKNTIQRGVHVCMLIYLYLVGFIHGQLPKKFMFNFKFETLHVIGFFVLMIQYYHFSYWRVDAV